jgi:hypothetical protein
MMGEIEITQLATLYGMSTFVGVLLGLLAKPILRAWKGEVWKWYGPVLNVLAAVLGIGSSLVVYGAVGGWELVNMILAVVTGVYAAAATVGIYEMARSRVPSVE